MAECRGPVRGPHDGHGFHRRRVRRAGEGGVVRVVDEGTQAHPHLVQRHPPGRVLDHERRDHVHHRAGSPRPGHLPVDDLGDRRDRVAVHVVGRAALDGGEERRAKAPEVGRGRHRLARRHLRRDVGGRAEHEARARHRRVRGVAGDAEVGELHATVVGDQHIARLDVTMGDAAAVRGAQTPRGGVADHRRLRRVERAVFADHRRQVAGRHELQHDHRLPVVDHDVEDRDDVRMREPAECPCLAHDAFAQVAGLLLGDARGNLQLLDRHPPLQHVVVAGPDRAHRAAAELPGQPVAPADAALLVVVGARHPSILTSGRSRTVGSPLKARTSVVRIAAGYSVLMTGVTTIRSLRRAVDSSVRRKAAHPPVRYLGSVRSRRATPRRVNPVEAGLGLEHRRPGEHHGEMHDRIASGRPGPAAAGAR